MKTKNFTIKDNKSISEKTIEMLSFAVALGYRYDKNEWRRLE